MRNFSVISTLIICSAAALGQNMVQLPCEAVATLRYHLCLKAPRATAAEATLLWNYIDSTNYSYLTYQIPPSIGNDYYHGLDIKYTTGVLSSGNDSLTSCGSVHAGTYSGSTDGLSAILNVAADGSASVEIGTAKGRTPIAINYDRHTPGSIGYRTSAQLKELRNDIMVSAMPPRRFAPFADSDTLMRYLAASVDPREGLWEILDRDTDPALAALGGNYRLATIANSRGGYDILYLGGATHGRDIWKPLQIKGTLAATQFADNYDLVWLTAAHKAAGEGTYGLFTLHNEILELHFPLHKTTLRLRRTH